MASERVKILFDENILWNHLNRWERAKWLIGHIEWLVALAEGMPKGSVYLMHKSGRHRSL
jgi:hypothetical protein